MDEAGDIIPRRSRARAADHPPRRRQPSPSRQRSERCKDIARPQCCGAMQRSPATAQIRAIESGDDAYPSGCGGVFDGFSDSSPRLTRYDRMSDEGRPEAASDQNTDTPACRMREMGGGRWMTDNGLSLEGCGQWSTPMLHEYGLIGSRPKHSDWGRRVALLALSQRPSHTIPTPAPYPHAATSCPPDQTIKNSHEISSRSHNRVTSRSSPIHGRNTSSSHDTRWCAAPTSERERERERGGVEIDGGESVRV